jgi:hypothetical protein
MKAERSFNRPSDVASLGGKARAKALSADERSELASHAALARWNRELPMATYSGELVFRDKHIACAVLETGKHLLMQESVGQALAGGAQDSSDDQTPAFLAVEGLRPFISDELREATTRIFFRDETGERDAGYDASLLPLVCEAYRKLHDHLLAVGTPISETQRQIIDTCHLLTEELAGPGGIAALIDKVTGYELARAKGKVAELLKHSGAGLQPWIRRFPDEFFWEFYSKRGRKFELGSSESQTDFVAFIDKYIFEMLPPDVLVKLHESSPKGERPRRRQKHIKLLIANTGNPHLDQQIIIVTTLLRSARDEPEFEELFDRAFTPKRMFCFSRGVAHINERPG